MRFTVIGAGSGGQCMAAHLTQLGHSVSLYDIDREKISRLQERGSITLENRLTGSAVIHRITPDLGEAVQGAEIIMVVTTTDAHGAVVRALAGLVTADQTIVLNPGHCGGALEFTAALKQAGLQSLPEIAECPTLIYGCRQLEPGHIYVTGIKKSLLLAGYPSGTTEGILQRLRPVYPQLKAASSILETSMSISGCLMHVIPTVMNTNKIDSGEAFDYYMEGITPHIALLMEHADRERVLVAEKLGVRVKTLREWLQGAYGLQPDSLYNMLQANTAYRGSASPKNFEHRFVLEDVTGGFVPLSTFGRVCGVDTPVIDLFIQLAGLVCEKDFRKLGRTAEALGLSGKTREEVIRLMTI